MKRDGRMKSLMMAGVISVALIGCPVEDSYDAGYALGFLQDDYYWDGFDDGWNTLDDYPIYYCGSDIPYVEEPPFDAGYYDGLWYAYNDGYFVDYDYAFTIGFSEGYDAAYYDDWYEFLLFDEHIEYSNGGWGDGYNDGFSEGRIFGAADYEDGWEFDWMYALDDYRAGVDLYFEELDLGTGVYGPVYLYEYGTDPSLKAAGPSRTPRHLAIRRAAGAKADEPDLFRPLTPAVEQMLNVRPATTARSARTLTLTTTWLERIQQYQAGASGEKAVQSRAK